MPPKRSRSSAEDSLAFQIRVTGLPKPERELRFCARRWRFDFAWPEKKLSAEVDGGVWIRGRHSRGSGIESDSEKFSTAAALGWRVMRFTPAMVNDGRAIRLLEKALTMT